MNSSNRSRSCSLSILGCLFLLSWSNVAIVDSLLRIPQSFFFFSEPKHPSLGVEHATNQLSVCERANPNRCQARAAQNLRVWIRICLWYFGDLVMVGQAPTTWGVLSENVQKEVRYCCEGRN